MADLCPVVFKPHSYIPISDVCIFIMKYQSETIKYLELTHGINTDGNSDSDLEIERRYGYLCL
jgi:hypothetical protein